MQLKSRDDLTPQPLSAMLEARSVAVVGASPRSGSVGWQAISQLIDGGFAGRIHPVTPSHREIAGLPARPSLADIEEPIDLTVLAVADHRLEELFDNALSAGTRSAVIFSPALGVASTGAPLRERLAEMAQEAAIPMCGPNGMGFLNLDFSLRVCGFFQPRDLQAGSITFLSHSGSLFSAMLHNRRPLCFNLVVSSGVELVVTMDQYLAYALERSTTRVIGLFLETVRQPAAMAAALTLARTHDLPVVALKVGRSKRGREAAATHSGALAGEDDVYRAFFESHGVHQVDSMAEMMDTLEVFSSPRRARKGGLGSVHDSGGERTMLLDHAETSGVPIATISEATRKSLIEILDQGLDPDNPVDAWGTGHDAQQVFDRSLRALAGDPAVGLLAFAVDLTAEQSPDAGYVDLLTHVHTETEVQLVVLSNLADGIDPDQARSLRRLGVAVLEGTETGLKAIGHALRQANQGPVPTTIPPGSPDLPARWRQRLALAQPWFELESLALIGEYGIPVVESLTAGSIEEAVAAFERIAGPVALKTAAGHNHKTEVDGVRIGLVSADQVAAAYHDLATRLGPQVLVQPMIADGVELAMGIVIDPQFGPLVVVAAGGRLVEVLDDRALALAPIDPAGAERILHRVRASRLLDGLRGSPPADRAAVIDALMRLSVLATDLGDLLAGVDVNPLIAGPAGVVAVDALIIPSIRSS